MKKLLLPLFLLGLSIICFSQEQEETAPFSYEVSGLFYAYKYDVAKRKPIDDKFKIPKPPLRFEIVRKEKHPTGNYDFYIIRFFDVISDDIKEGGKTVSLTDNPLFINSADNQEYFWISQDELTTLLDNKTIKKSFKLTSDIAYGANVSLPFKLRPKVNEQNIRITPDITLSGFLGAKFRISRKDPYYIVPLVSLGLATLPISDETDGSVTDKGDGMVLGITTSTGVVFQLKDFQFGFLVGWDRAAGELGKNWVYNGKPWYSFSIGFTFLGNNKPPEEKK